MLRRCVALAGPRKLPNPGSSLLNPRSHRAQVRRAAATHAEQSAHFESQALYAELDGTGGEGNSNSRTHTRPVRSRRQRSSQHVRRVVGRDVAERAKSMTDSEWASVLMEEKHAFTKYMAEVLHERPTEASEQQRRRYFETTMVDPRDLDPNRTVRDDYERLKMGLPVQLKNPQRTLGVSQAVFESGDASLFDPEKADALEEAMTQIKQVFADYTRERREGVSTEASRRRLANMMAELNLETQRHLSHMFKYAESKVREVTREERQRQLTELSRLRRALTTSKSTSSPAAPPKAEETETPSAPLGAEGAEEAASIDGSAEAAPSPSSLAKTKKRATLRRSLSKALGMELDVVESLITELDAQETFMRFCEVFARLTVARGFEHGPGDEGLDAYTESVRRLYSVDAQKLSTLDVVQYLAAKSDTHPVDWAKRWYERLLRLPLENTPEFRRLEAMRDDDKAALAVKAADHTSTGKKMDDDATSADPGVAASPGHTAAKAAERAAAGARAEKAVRLVEKMFMRPDDPRLSSLHEKRLRYISYLQMERQIAQARENACMFAGVEAGPEAEQCRLLYQQLLERRELLSARPSSADAGDAAAQEVTVQSSSPTDDSKAAVATSKEADNIFAKDPKAAALFEQIRDITQSTIRRYRREARGQSAAAKKAATLARVVSHVKGPSSNTAAALQELLQEKKTAVTRRLLSVLEADVKSDVEWLDAMEDAERPPLLPVPEGMSYVSAADVRAWKEVRGADAAVAADPFKKNKKKFQPTLFGQPWQLPDKPLLFWGTGTRAVQQALEHAAGDADRRRHGKPLAPPYPCPENPWGWRLAKDILDD